MKRAFTLAEVLITLGIIGVVAAITIPMVVGAWQEKVTVNKVAHAYSLISQAYLQTIGDDLDATTLGCKTTECFLEALGKNLKVLSITYLNTLTISTLNGDNINFNGYYRMVLENGYIIYARDYFSPTCGLTYSNWDDVDDMYKTICQGINIDINGEKKPNALGRDIFHFYLLKDRVYPMGGAKEPYYQFKWLCNKNRPGTWDGEYNGVSCAAWVLFNKNMDYLHCNDLNWNGKSKCGK